VTDLSDLLRPDAVRFDVSAASRKAALTLAARALSPAVGLDGRVLGELFAERERLGTTGFGHGVAIPHGRAPVPGVSAAFLRLARPVGWSAVDGEPVDLVFAMVSPPDAGADHLKALARASRALRDAGFLAKLRGAGSGDALWALLSGSPA